MTKKKDRRCGVEVREREVKRSVCVSRAHRVVGVLMDVRGREEKEKQQQDVHPELLLRSGDDGCLVG